MVSTILRLEMEAPPNPFLALVYTSGVLPVSNGRIAVAQESRARPLDRIVAFSIVPMSNLPMLYIFAKQKYGGADGDRTHDL